MGFAGSLFLLLLDWLAPPTPSGTSSASNDTIEFTRTVGDVLNFDRTIPDALDFTFAISDQIDF